MTKAIFCRHCGDIFAPLRGDLGPWRHCHCGLCAARWRNGMAGKLEVSAVTQDSLFVMGLNNVFIRAAMAGPMTDLDWRTLHKGVCADAHGYLFHTDKRDCWALLVRPGESNDIFFVPWNTADKGPKQS